MCLNNILHFNILYEKETLILYTFIKTKSTTLYMNECVVEQLDNYLQLSNVENELKNLMSSVKTTVENKYFDLL